MKPYQALLLDVDGTLVKKDRSLSPEVITAIDRARQAGIKVSLATSRAFISLTSIFNQIGWEGVHITAGGAQVIDGTTKQIVWGKSMTSDQVKWLYDEVSRRDGGVVIVKSDALYTYDQLVEHFQHHPWHIPAKNISLLTNDWSSPLVSVHQLSPALEQFLTTQTQLHAVKMINAAGLAYYDVTAWGVTKKAGLLAWSEATHIPLSQVVSVGDGLNDRELLTMVGLPVAMGNAVEEIKALAKKQVATNDQNGVAELIRWLIDEN